MNHPAFSMASTAAICGLRGGGKLAKYTLGERLQLFYDAFTPSLSEHFRSYRRLLLVALSITTLVACNGSDGDAKVQAAPEDVGAAMVAAAEASVATHPLCALAQFDEVRAVVGGHIAKLDVIDEESLHSVDCVFLDSQDLYNGLSIKFITSERLIKTASRWSSAKAYFEEWSRGGAAVSELGDAAAWVDLPGGLLALQGEHVLHLSSSKADITKAEIRTRFEILARQVLSRLP